MLNNDEAAFQAMPDESPGQVKLACKYKSVANDHRMHILQQGQMKKIQLSTSFCRHVRGILDGDSAHP